MTEALDNPRHARSIVYVAGQFPSTSETFVYREVRALRERGWSVTAVALRETDEGRADRDPSWEDLYRDRLVVYGRAMRTTLGAAARELLRRPGRSVGTLWAAIRDGVSSGAHGGWGARLKIAFQGLVGVGLAGRLRERAPEHVHCHFAHAPATVGMYCARQLGAGFSFTGHANDLFQRRVLLERKLAGASFVACISEWHRQWYRSFVADGDHRYRVIRCGVDTAGWQPMNGEGGADEPASEAIHLVSVCRLVHKKGIDTLLEALAALNREQPGRWRLTVAGDGPEGPTLREQARLLKLESAVDWLGSVPNDRVRELLYEADLFVLPCRADREGDRDGIPVVLMEAMAIGVPVVTGDLPAIRELVVDGQTGALVPGEDAKALAGRLGELGQSEAGRAELGRAGRRHVEAEFSLETNIQRLEEALRGDSPATNR